MLSSNVQFENSIVIIPQKILSINYIITDIFGNTFKPNNEEIREKLILSPKNNDVLALNNDILSRLEGQTNVYLSVDSASEDNDEIVHCAKGRKWCYTPYFCNKGMTGPFLRV